MHARAGRLADDQNACIAVRAHDGARAERQVGFACAAGADFGEQHVERRARSFRHRFESGDGAGGTASSRTAAARARRGGPALRRRRA